MFQAKESKERLDVVKSLMACKTTNLSLYLCFRLEGNELFDSPDSTNLRERLNLEIAPTSDPKEAVCFYCNTKGHWKRSCLKYLKDLKDRKVEKGSHSGCGTYIYAVMQGLKESRRLKHGELNLVMGNRKITLVTRIRKYELMLKSEVRIDLNNSSPYKGIYKSVKFISNNGNVILNVGSSNVLDKSKLWHSRLGHVNKKRITQLQKDGVLESFDFKSDDVCKSCLLGKMTKSPFIGTCEEVKDYWT
ncbi:retrotransposon protein, putative, ty1-copia subclass [Tanacetum coccineum]